MVSGVLQSSFLDVLETIDDAVKIIDVECRVVYVNRAWEQIVGVGAKRVLGRNLAVLDPDDKLLQVLKTGEPIYHQDLEQDGCHFLVSCLPLKNHEGMVVGAIGIGTPSPVYHLLQQLAPLATSRKERCTGAAIGDRNALPKPFTKIIGNDLIFVRSLNMAAVAARADCTILLRGETGVGKGLIAEVVHESSRRAAGPFVPVNCAAIPETLLESELFGYESGAFTGASPKGKPGKFEEAHGGTLFLDEVGDLSLNMQAKLLRAIESKTIERVGGTKPKKVDIRLIAATNKDLELLVQEMQFRADLYYRVNVVPILVPSLRERSADIEALATHFLTRLSGVYGKQVSLSPAVFDAFQKHVWPGNVRELANVVEHSVVMCQGSVILPEHLPEYLRSCLPTTAHTETSFLESDSLGKLIEDLERKAISTALKKAGNNRSKAMRLLGISRRAFYSKLHKYQLG